MAETKTPSTSTDKAAEKAPTKPKVGAFVSTGDGPDRRIGLVISDGREPGPDEGPEPEVLWLPGNPTAFGGDLTTL